MANQSLTDVSNHADRDILTLSASQIRQQIVQGLLSAAEVVDAFIRRIREIQPAINAMTVDCFESARQQARQLDNQVRSGQFESACLPLLGVPVTIKEAFAVHGTPATMGLVSRATELASTDAPLVTALRNAGAIVLGKTNVPQLMFFHETDNPLYGRTNNPWDLQRTCGGSTGGEAALIAAYGSPLGLGSDLGGSIRVPSHFCGIHGLKPTNRRFTRTGSVANLRGMTGMEFQPGPMARCVDDLQTMCEVLATASAPDQIPAAFPDSGTIDVSRLRIGIWRQDDLFPVSSAVKLAVENAANVLQQAGADVVEFAMPHVRTMVQTYLGLMSADGGRDLQQLLGRDPADHRIRHLLRIGRIPPFARPGISAALRMVGQPNLAFLLQATGATNASGFWRLNFQREDCASEVRQLWQQMKLDALICPVHAVPAFPHGDSVDLVLAAIYSFVFNLIGFPAGSVAIVRSPATQTQNSPQPEPQVANPSRLDVVVKKTERAVRTSSHLPVGVQVVAEPWREDVVLGVMRYLAQSSPNSRN